jgi:hypothetical protein
MYLALILSPSSDPAQRSLDKEAHTQLLTSWYMVQYIIPT